MDFPTPSSASNVSASPDLSPAMAERLYAQQLVDVAGRLRRVCEHMPDEQFDELVRDICALKFRWAQAARPTPVSGVPKLS
jgi:hypothetical protein